MQYFFNWIGKTAAEFGLSEAQKDNNRLQKIFAPRVSAWIQLQRARV
jgi:hypothetical protein